MERKTLLSSKTETLEVKAVYYLCPLAFIHPSNVIFPFWFIDKSALAYRSSSWTNPAISMQLYRYNFTTVDFQASCTSTCLCCTGTMCPLPIFKQVVPVHICVVPVQCAHWHFSSKLYWYIFVLYRYNVLTATFQASCTGTYLCCTGTMCPGAFLALLEFPRLYHLFAHILSASYWLPGHTSLYTYVLNLKDLHKSKNIEEIRSTYPYAKCE